GSYPTRRDVNPSTAWSSPGGITGRFRLLAALALNQRPLAAVALDHREVSTTRCARAQPATARLNHREQRNGRGTADQPQCPARSAARGERHFIFLAATFASLFSFLVEILA